MITTIRISSAATPKMSGRYDFHKQMRVHGAPGGGLPRPERFDAVVTEQFQQLESIVKAHGSIMLASRISIRASINLEGGAGVERPRIKAAGPLCARFLGQPRKSFFRNRSLTQRKRQTRGFRKVTEPANQIRTVEFVVLRSSHRRVPSDRVPQEQRQRRSMRHAKVSGERVRAGMRRSGR